MRRALIASVALLVTGGAVALGAIAISGDDEPVAPARFTPTPLSEVDTGTLIVARDSFCDVIDPREVDLALGTEPESSDSWSDGDSVTDQGVDLDVVHEYGCSWTADSAVARAWVFAPPIGDARAASLVKDATRTRGCEPVADPPAFGTPSTALVCQSTKPARTTTSWRGLFGDAWLVCELVDSSPDALDRADGWCSAVARAASN